MKRELEKEFGKDIEVGGEETPVSTGYLEVAIVGGKLLHSRKNGDGFVDSASKKKKIMDGIRAALK